MTPIISVVMSTYNRAEIVCSSIESILNQTFSDFEFIIINDKSTDDTENIIKNYKDTRIILLNNKVNCGCTFNYHNAHNIAKGKYIAHIDDDDISCEKRLQVQYNFLEENYHIDLAGTYIETFGENQRPSWVFYSAPEDLDFIMNLYNPICHSSIMYRKSFTDKMGINYDISKKCAQDYDFYKQIIMKGGKLANIEEVLTKYRMHSQRLTDIKDTQNIQIYNAEKIKTELLNRIFDEKEIDEIKYQLKDFPFNNYNIENVEKALNIIKEKNREKHLYKEETIGKVIFDLKKGIFKF